MHGSIESKQYYDLKIHFLIGEFLIRGLHQVFYDGVFSSYRHSLDIKNVLFYCPSFLVLLTSRQFIVCRIKKWRIK